MDNGEAVDASGIINGLTGPQGEALTFNGARDLSQRVADNLRARGCFTTNYYRFARGFDAKGVDTCAINKLKNELVGADLALPDLFVELALKTRTMEWLALYDSEDEVRALRPDMGGITATGVHGVIVTAKGKDCDFVSRFFAPGAGVPEDPVTGSAHTRLVPFWAERLRKTTFFARQVSARGGELWCELQRGRAEGQDQSLDRVRIAGQAALFLEGTIEI